MTSPRAGTLCPPLPLLRRRRSASGSGTRTSRRGQALPGPARASRGPPTPLRRPTRRPGRPRQASTGRSTHVSDGRGRSGVGGLPARRLDLLESPVRGRGVAPTGRGYSAAGSPGGRARGREVLLLLRDLGERSEDKVRHLPVRAAGAVPLVGAAIAAPHAPAMGHELLTLVEALDRLARSRTPFLPGHPRAGRRWAAAARARWGRGIAPTTKPGRAT